MGLRSKIKKYFYNKKFNNDSILNELKNENILITGSSSGIGLSILKLLIKENNILAVCNKNKENLDNINDTKLTVVKCDLMNMNDYDSLNNEIKRFNTTMIINCAGVFGSNNQDLSNIDFDNFINVIKLNSLSILKILQMIFLNQSNSLKMLVNISSDGGSINLNNQGNAYIYRTSKSALNSITKNLSIDINKKYGTIVFAIDPGNVKTNMNNKGLMNSDKCANLIVNMICKNQKNLNGKFINLLNEEIPW